MKPDPTQKKKLHSRRLLHLGSTYKADYKIVYCDDFTKPTALSNSNGIEVHNC